MKNYCGIHNSQLRKGGRQPAPLKNCGKGILADHKVGRDCGTKNLTHRLLRKEKKARLCFENVMLELNSHLEGRALY